MCWIKKFFLSKKKEKWIQNSIGGIGEHLSLLELLLVFGVVAYFGRGIYVKMQNMDLTLVTGVARLHKKETNITFGKSKFVLVPVFK